MKFELTANDPKSSARAGVLQTDHGEIQTPIFMPVGTAGSVKAVHQRELEHDVQAQIILGNTYHLYLRPGLGVLEQAGLVFSGTSPAELAAMAVGSATLLGWIIWQKWPRRRPATRMA